MTSTTNELADFEIAVFPTPPGWSVAANEILPEDWEPPTSEILAT